MRSSTIIDLGPAVDPDAELLTRLRAGDEAAFLELVGKYGPVMKRIALGYVRTPAIAEEVVQDAWLGALRSLHRFEGRSSLKTWLLRILANRARTRGEREARCVPFSTLAGEDDGPSVPAERFQGTGGWASIPTDWDTLPEARLLARETLARVDDAIRRLPARQQEVMVLRDVEGWSSDEVCAALELTASNQRVLLHRARSSVRGALEAYLECS